MPPFSFISVTASPPSRMPAPSPSSFVQLPLFKQFAQQTWEESDASSLSPPQKLLFYKEVLKGGARQARNAPPREALQDPAAQLLLMRSISRC
eukprot:6645622-Pyramimonas_sp.AAC.1